MADHHRSDRVAAAMREEIATFLANDVKDPRIMGLVTVTAVEITRDLPFEGTPVLSDDEFDRASEEIASIVAGRTPVLA